MSRRQALWWGQGRTSGTPAYYESSAIASDASTAFALLGKTATFYPFGRGGEALFRMAHLSVQHVASATLRVTPVLEHAQGTLSGATGTLTAMPATLILPQQAGEPRVAAYPIPLVMEYARSSVPIARVSCRGVGLALLIETVGSVGTGMLVVDAVEVEYEPLEKAQHETVTA